MLVRDLLLAYKVMVWISCKLPERVSSKVFQLKKVIGRLRAITPGRLPEISPPSFLAPDTSVGRTPRKSGLKKDTAQGGKQRKPLTPSC